MRDDGKDAFPNLICMYVLVNVLYRTTTTLFTNTVNDLSTTIIIYAS